MATRRRPTLGPQGRGRQREQGARRSELSSLNPELVAFATFGHIEEQLVERKTPLDQALLVRIGHQALEISGVALAQPVLPGVLAEDRLLLLPALAVPGERDDARVLHPLHGE